MFRFVHVTIVEVKKNNYYIFWVCVCVCVCVCVFLPYLTSMQIPYFLNYIMFSSLACVPLPPCPTLSHKRYDCQWNVADHKIVPTIIVLNTTHFFMFVPCISNIKILLLKSK